MVPGLIYQVHFDPMNLLEPTGPLAAAFYSFLKSEQKPEVKQPFFIMAHICGTASWQRAAEALMFRRQLKASSGF